MATYETAWEEVERAMPAHREASARTRGDEDRGTPLIQPVTVGVFRRKGGEFNAAAKPALGILLVLSNCKDTHDEKEFNRWYEDVHIPDILDTGAFHTAYRYESTDPEATKGKYLAIYETDNQDPAAARDSMGAGARGLGKEGPAIRRDRRRGFPYGPPHLAYGLARVIRERSPCDKGGPLRNGVPWACPVVTGRVLHMPAGRGPGRESCLLPECPAARRPTGWTLWFPRPTLGTGA